MSNISFNLTTSFLQLLLLFVLIVLIAGLIFSAIGLFKELKKISGWRSRVRFLLYSSKFYLTLGLVFLVGFTAFYIYQVSRDVVVNVSTKQFVKIQEHKLAELQKQGSSRWVEAGLLLIDVRQPEDYDKEHIAGSRNMTVKKVETTPFASDTDIAIIYDKDDKQNIRALAKRIAQLQEDYDPNLSDGRIYVISGDFDDLKKAGLTTEVGGYD